MASQFGTETVACSGFGRRTVPPAKKVVTREKAILGHVVYPADAKRKALKRHPGSFFRR
ncbi:MAG: hypothetical protein WBQ17_06985 [Rhizomicrobium sp.]|jgi:hypothetical protein